MNIINYGKRLAPSIYDHNIDKHIWKKLLDYVRDTTQFKQIMNAKKFKIYQLGELTYEFDTEIPNHYQCWTDTFDFNNPNPIEIKHALLYKRHRHIHKYNFQPVNTYYNIHEVTRHIFSINDILVIFEEKNQIHELIIISQRDYQTLQSDPTSKSLIDFMTMVNEYLHI